MNRDLVRQVRSARVSLGLTVALGLLAAAATVGQLVVLSKVVDGVFLQGADLLKVRGLLLLLLVASILRSALLWGRRRGSRSSMLTSGATCRKFFSACSCR